MTVGQWLASRREDAGLTQEQLSLASGVKRSTIAGIEAGHAKSVSVPTARKLGKALKIDWPLFFDCDSWKSNNAS